MSAREINRYLIIAFCLLILSLAFFEYSDFDIFLQNKFYNSQEREWAIDAKEPIKRFIFLFYQKFF